MAISKAKKDELVAEYTDLINESRGVIFTEYRGLVDRDLKIVRGKIREADGLYRVTKLSLLRIALENAGYPIPETFNEAPVAVGFCLNEVPAVAKAIKEAADQFELFTIQGGIIDGNIVDESQIKALADLPSMDELRSMIAGLLEAPASNLVGVLQSGVSQVVNVVHAYVEQGEGA